MITAALFFQIFGVLFGVLGLALLVHSEYYTAMIQKVLKNDLFFFVGGLFALILGTFILYFQNAWEWNILLLLTLTGWAAVLKGAFFLLCPKGATAIAEWIFKIPYILYIAGAGCILLSGVFLYVGYSAQFSL